MSDSIFAVEACHAPGYVIVLYALTSNVLTKVQRLRLIANAKGVNHG
ncbi:hypothetical protein [Grimontia sp. SpTr1]|nr:hypothetical protein [Grimontia sp. SpTr1]